MSLTRIARICLWWQAAVGVALVPSFAHARDSVRIERAGLVPLQELNRAPYASLWFADGRFHVLQVGLSANDLRMVGEASRNDDGTTQEFDGEARFIGAYAGYYVPLVGFTPDFSIGLLPEAHLSMGAGFSGTQNVLGGTVDETKINVAMNLPVYLMARLGKYASRYGPRDFSVGAGVGGMFLALDTGAPIAHGKTLIQPAARVEAGYSFYNIGLEWALASTEGTIETDQARTRLSYSSFMVTLGVAFQPHPDG